MTYGIDQCISKNTYKIPLKIAYLENIGPCLFEFQWCGLINDLKVDLDEHIF